LNKQNSCQTCMFFTFIWKNPWQKPKLVRDQDQDQDNTLKFCYRQVLGAQRVEKHCPRVSLDIWMAYYLEAPAIFSQITSKITHRNPWICEQDFFTFSSMILLSRQQTSSRSSSPFSLLNVTLDSLLLGSMSHWENGTFLKLK
jgi:hypothetical protein